LYTTLYYAMLKKKTDLFVYNFVLCHKNTYKLYQISFSKSYIVITDPFL